MNCYNAKFICFVCIVALGLHSSQSYAGVAPVGRVAMNAASGVLTAVKNVLPAKSVAIAALCIAGGMTAKALWTRYITLSRIDAYINPEVLLYVDQRHYPIYNWMMGAPGFTTPAQIRSNYQNVKASLVTACLSGQVDIFQYRTGVPLVTGNNIFWADVMSTIDGEIARIRRVMISLESFVGVSFRGIHLFGMRKNFAQACSDLGLGGLDQMRHAMTVGQDEHIEALMTEDRGMGERLVALLMANPNYDKAYRIFWELDHRLGRLRAIKEAVVYTPVNWNIALH
jgi:hypothetical protein